MSKPQSRRFKAVNEPGREFDVGIDRVLYSFSRLWIVWCEGSAGQWTPQGMACAHNEQQAIEEVSASITTARGWKAFEVKTPRPISIIRKNLKEWPKDAATDQS